MLRRQSTKSKPDGPRRRKSTSSVQGVHLEHLDAVTAQRDAQTAAQQAYLRAQDRLSAAVDAMSLFPSPHASPTKSLSSSSPQRRQRHRTDDPSNYGGRPSLDEVGTPHRSELGRQQSVRFAGPNSASKPVKISNNVVFGHSSSNENSRQSAQQEMTSRTFSRCSYLADGSGTFDPLSSHGPTQTQGQWQRQGGDRSGQAGPSPHPNMTAPWAPETDAQNSSRIRPRRRPPPIPGTTPEIALAKEHLKVLSAGEEYYTAKDDIASVPTSYRRLRRSRSMFTSDDDGLQGSSHDGRPPGSQLAAGGGFRGLRPCASRSIFPTSKTTSRAMPSGAHGREVGPMLRAPKSMSFLRARQARSGSTASREAISDGVDTHARQRDNILSKSEGSTYPQEGRPKQTFIFGSKSSRQNETGMRKTLRGPEARAASLSTKTNGGGGGGGFPAALARQHPDATLRTKARKVSRSLKTRLKSLFSMSSSKSDDESCLLPVQHIEAHKTHVTEGFGMSSLTRLEPQHTSDDSSAEWSSVHRVVSKVASVQNVPPGLARSSKGSLESLRSEHLQQQQERKVSAASSEDKSLTSWTNSGPSTLTSQQQQAWREWERQRLSIIRENGTHAPSPSIQRQALGEHHLAAYHEDDSALGQPLPAPPIIDSQRVYSALMKRMQDINNNNERAHVEAQERQESAPRGAEIGQPLIVMPPVDAGAQGMLISSQTIRCVPPEDSFADTPTRKPKNSRQFDGGGVRSICSTEEESKGMASTTFLSSTCARSASNSTDSSAAGNTFSETYGSKNDKSSLCPPIAIMPSVSGIKEPPKATQSDRGSAFFGSPTSHLFRTTSPYRRALQRSMEEEKHVQTGTYKPSHSDDASAAACPTAGPFAEVTTEYSESEYSTDNAAGRLSRLGSSGKDMTRRTAQEAATALSPPTYQPTTCDGGGGSGNRKSRAISTATSVDWKAWLSANVAKLEPCVTPPPMAMPGSGAGRRLSSSTSSSTQSEVEYALPTMPKNTFVFKRGHLREAAQIHEDSYDNTPTPEAQAGLWAGGDQGHLQLESVAEERQQHHHQPPARSTMTRQPNGPLGSVEPNVVKPSPPPRSAKRTTAPSAPPIPNAMAWNSTPAVPGLRQLEKDTPESNLSEMAMPCMSASTLFPNTMLPPPPPPPPIPTKSALRTGYHYHSSSSATAASPCPLRHTGVSTPNINVIAGFVPGSSGYAVRRSATPSLASTPGLTAAVQRQFGAVMVPRYVPASSSVAGHITDAPAEEDDNKENEWGVMGMGMLGGGGEKKKRRDGELALTVGGGGCDSMRNRAGTPKWAAAGKRAGEVVMGDCFRSVHSDGGEREEADESLAFI